MFRSTTRRTTRRSAGHVWIQVGSQWLTVLIARRLGKRTQDWSKGSSDPVTSIGTAQSDDEEVGL